MKKCFFGLFLSILFNLANASTCHDQYTKSINNVRSEHVAVYGKNFSSTQKALNAFNETQAEMDSDIKKRIAKLNSLSISQVSSYVSEFNDWIESTYNDSGGIQAIIFFECLAKERLSRPRNMSRNPQTISSGPVSVTLIPTNSPVSKCYDIQYINRGSKHIDIFIKLTLTNNKTGESGTSVWLGSNTNFDGLFGSANSNRLNPYADAISTRTNMYSAWLMAQNFIFNNQPWNMYGFNDIVESCDDITAEIPAGGLKWNENAYQRHYDAEKKKR